MAKTIRWNLNKVIEYIKDNSECELISTEFFRAKDKLLFKCKCNNIFETTFENFRLSNKRQCHNCGRNKMIKKQSLNYEDILEYVKSNSECELVSKEYINSKSLLKFKCNCGKLFDKSFEKFKSKSKNCKECSYNKIKLDNKYTYEYIKSFIESKNCKLITNYYNSSYQKLEIKCKCNEIYEVNFSTFKNNNQIRCKLCTNSISKGEILIKEYLINNNFIFEEQFKFENLKADNKKQYLRYDFCVKLNIEKILIEFDGKQHFQAVDFYGGKNAYEILKSNDQKKNNYAKDNNIKLIRISYLDINNINSILNEKLIIQ